MADEVLQVLVVILLWIVPVFRHPASRPLSTPDSQAIGELLDLEHRRPQSAELDLIALVVLLWKHLEETTKVLHVYYHGSLAVIPRWGGTAAGHFAGEGGASGSKAHHLAGKVENPH